jgi:hypothetical protein
MIPIPYPESDWNDHLALIMEARKILGDRAALFHLSGQAGVFFDDLYLKKQTMPPWVTPWNDLAKYADIIVTAWPDASFEIVADQLAALTSSDIVHLNMTAWGNTAYIAINARKPLIRKLATKFLSKWCEDAKSQNQIFANEIDRISGLNKGRKPN